jgi:hypothetical protein
MKKEQPVAATIRSHIQKESVKLTELPERPTGWTKHLAVHYNYGEKGGAATYTIRDDKGRQTNIGYAYDTRKSKGAPRGEAGFFVNGSELMSWADLRRRFTELTQANPEVKPNG